MRRKKERRKEASKVKQTNKAKQHSTPMYTLSNRMETPFGILLQYTCTCIAVQYLCHVQCMHMYSCTVLVSCTMRVHAHVLLSSGAMHAAELAWIYSKQQLPFSNIYQNIMEVFLHVQHPSDARYNAFACDMRATCMYGHARTRAHTHQTHLLD